VFAIVLFSIVIAGILGLLMAGSAARPAPRIVDPRPPIPGAELRTLTIALLDRLGLEVVEEEPLGEDRRLLAAQRDAELRGARYVVFIAARPPSGVVPPSTVVELAQSVEAERATAGLLVTPDRIDAAGMAGMEVPIELVDGPRLRALIRQHLPERAGELDRWRGFSAAPAPFVPAAT
jgi:hypothetical protein